MGINVFGTDKPLILHIITGLPVGGAQTTLRKVATRSADYGFDSLVVSLTDHGHVGKELNEAWGIPVIALNMKPSRPDLISFLRLCAVIRRHRPALVQTWMYHADLMGGLANRFVGGPPLLWNIRQSNLDTRFSKKMTIWTAKVSARLSRYLPEKIICGSESARKVHTALGYQSAKMTVILNGVDVLLFTKDPHARSRLRTQIGADAGTPIIGYAARWDSQKDHACFVRAAHLLRKRCPDVRFILCGDGITKSNVELARWIHDAKINSCTHLLGRRDDMHEVYPAFDIATSSARYGEGFPNVLVEALACGVPCASTDVGDSSTVVGNAGRIVPISDAEALALAWEELLSLPRESWSALQETARRRATECFDLNKMVDRYYSIYEALMAPQAIGSRLSTPR